MTRSRGSINKKGANYYIVLNLTDSAGKRQRKWISAGPSLKEAKQLLTQELGKLDAGTFISPAKETVGEFLSRWITTAESSLTVRTAEGYRTILNRAIPALGNIRLRKVGPADIQEYISDLLRKNGRLDGSGPVSPLTAIHHLRMLHRSFRDAISWGLISRNPCDGVTAPRAKGNEIHVMSEDEIGRFLEAAQEGDYYPLYHTFLYTGCRRSELLAARWCDFDPLRLTLTITRSVHLSRTGEYVFQPTKTAAGKRIIDLTSTPAKVIQDYRQQVALQCIELGTMLKETDLIFSKWDGTPLRPDTITRHWSDLCKRLGISAHRLHDARHTHASILLKSGVPAHVVSQRLGHSGIGITVNVYGHIMKGMGAVAAKAFDEALRMADNKVG
jgi:integrase